MKKISIKQLFEDKQEQMLKTFGLNAHILHAGAKGDVTEEEWVNWFNTYLPKKFQATSHGFVIDCNGSVSDQIDIIIYDTLFSPLVFELNGQKYIAAESVYAVFEVKQDLTKEHIAYAAEKIKSVRSLERTSAGIRQLDGRVLKKEPFEILGGLLTIRTEWKETRIAENVRANIKGLSPSEEINFVCCLASFACEIVYPQGEGGGRVPELIENAESGALIYTYVTLFKMLQDLGNCAAIDYDRYGVGK